MKEYGYVRVSAAEQNEDRQLLALAEKQVPQPHAKTACGFFGLSAPPAEGLFCCLNYENTLFFCVFKSANPQDMEKTTNDWMNDKKYCIFLKKTLDFQE